MRYTQRSPAFVSFQDAISPLFAFLPERPTDQFLVVDDENVFPRHFVSRAYYAGPKVKVVVSSLSGHASLCTIWPIGSRPNVGQSCPRSDS